MLKSKGVAILVILLLVTLLLPATVLASKQAYKARLSTGAELHDVIDSTARGSAVFSISPDGLDFQMFVRNLSGPPTGAHIHGPATASETAGVVVSLCGNPAPAAVTTCTFDASTGTMELQGEITSSLLAQWGVTANQLSTWLDDELLYVNVHTASNPAGEVRGQILP